MKSILQAFFILIFTANIGACNPMKVTDPSDPQFNPDQFEYSDYYDNKVVSLKQAYIALFPPGTPKEFVDRVLVKSGGAKSGCLPDRNVCLYERPARMMDIKGPPKFKVIYNSKNEVINISMNGGFTLFDDEAHSLIKVSDVIDSNDVKVDVKKFNFSDYGTRDELRDAFKKIFIPGTSKSYVDQVLVEFGGAEIGSTREVLETPPKYIFISYREPINFFRSIKKPAHHIFIFDENSRLINIMAFGASKLFKNMPDYEELNAMKHQGDTHRNP